MSEENEMNVTNMVKGRPRKYPYPAKMVCTVTGKTVSTNPKQFAGLMKRMNKTQEEVIASFISREGKQYLKDQQTQKEAAALPTPVEETPVVS